MAVVIGEIVTETVVVPPPEPAPARDLRDDAELELVVRRAAERVLEILHREWDR